MKKSFILYFSIIASFLFLLAYVINFYSVGFSSKSSEWGGFGSYISGTVGVLILISTLYYLVKATEQQDKLLTQQDIIINEQTKEFKKNEAFRATEMAVNYFEKLNLSFIDSHINKHLHVKVEKIESASEQDQFLAWSLTRGIRLMDIMSNYTLYPKHALESIKWLDDDDILLKTRAITTITLLEPILSHLNLITHISEKSVYAEKYIQNITSDLDKYFYISILFYSSYLNSSNSKHLAKNLPYLTQNKISILDFKSSTYESEYDSFWSKLGVHVANYENLENRT